MNKPERLWFSWWNALPENHPFRALGMTALVATVAALVVSSSVIFLQPKQQANELKSRQALLNNIVNKLPGLEAVLMDSGVDALSTRWVQLESGLISAEPPSPEYDAEAALNDPRWSKEIAKADDVAGIARRHLYVPVYLLEKQNRLALVVLPVYGVGYQSTIHAWLALSGDVQNVVSLSIVEQAETPGLGSRIEDPDWLALWRNRSLYNETGDLTLRVATGPAATDDEIDGISGATRTGNGINNLLQYWLGDQGFGPFLNKIEQGALAL